MTTCSWQSDRLHSDRQGRLLVSRCGSDPAAPHVVQEVGVSWGRQEPLTVLRLEPLRRVMLLQAGEPVGLGGWLDAAEGSPPPFWVAAAPWGALGPRGRPG